MRQVSTLLPLLYVKMKAASEHMLLTARDARLIHWHVERVSGTLAALWKCYVVSCDETVSSAIDTARSTF